MKELERGEGQPSQDVASRSDAPALHNPRYPDLSLVLQALDELGITEDNPLTSDELRNALPPILEKLGVDRPRIWVIVDAMEQADTEIITRSALMAILHEELGKFRDEYLRGFQALRDELLTGQQGWQGKADGLTTKVDDLTTKVDGHSKDINNLTTKVDGLTTKVDDLTTKVDGHSKDINGLATKVDGHSKDINGLATKVDDLAKDVKALPKEIQSATQRTEAKIEDRANEAREANRRTEDKIDALAEKMSGIVWKVVVGTVTALAALASVLHFLLGL